jgi:hypothetical protein
VDIAGLCLRANDCVVRGLWCRIGQAVEQELSFNHIGDMVSNYTGNHDNTLLPGRCLTATARSNLSIPQQIKR